MKNHSERFTTEALEMLNAVESASVIHCYAENQVFFPLHTQALDAIHKGDTWGCLYGAIT